MIFGTDNKVGKDGELQLVDIFAEKKPEQQSPVSDEEKQVSPSPLRLAANVLIDGFKKDLSVDVAGDAIIKFMSYLQESQQEEGKQAANNWSFENPGLPLLPQQTQFIQFLRDRLTEAKERSIPKETISSLENYLNVYWPKGNYSNEKCIMTLDPIEAPPLGFKLDNGTWVSTVDLILFQLQRGQASGELEYPAGRHPVGGASLTQAEWKRLNLAKAHPLVVKALDSLKAEAFRTGDSGKLCHVYFRDLELQDLSSVQKKRRRARPGLPPDPARREPINVRWIGRSTFLGAVGGGVLGSIMGLAMGAMAFIESSSLSFLAAATWVGAAFGAGVGSAGVLVWAIRTELERTVEQEIAIVRSLEEEKKAAAELDKEKKTQLEVQIDLAASREAQVNAMLKQMRQVYNSKSTVAVVTVALTNPDDLLVNRSLSHSAIFPTAQPLSFVSPNASVNREESLSPVIDEQKKDGHAEIKPRRL